MGRCLCAGLKLRNRILQAGEDTPGHFITGHSASAAAALKTQVLWLVLDCKSPTSTAGAFWGENIRLRQTLMVSEHEPPCVTRGWGSHHATRPRLENALQKQNFGI